MLVAFLVVVNLFITFVGAGLERDPRSVLFSWPSLAVVAVLGLTGIVLTPRTGFPAAWDARISNRHRLAYPVLLGVGFGLLSVGLDQLTGWIAFFKQETGLPAFNAPFPGSLLFYPGGAILVEVFYRLLPIPVLLWLMSNGLLRGRGQAPLFWVLAVLTSLIEPLSQDLEALRVGAVGLFASQFGYDYGFNLAQAVLFRRYGFLAAIVLRAAQYLVWHVGYGNFLCSC
jgi:hypothetical protein